MERMEDQATEGRKMMGKIQVHVYRPDDVEIVEYSRYIDEEVILQGWAEFLYTCAPWWMADAVLGEDTHRVRRLREALAEKAGLVLMG